MFLGVISPTPSSEPPSITESMQMVDEILSDTKMNRFDRIEKLEAVLNSVIAGSQDMSSMDYCNCHCHQNGSTNHVQTTDVECQTLSTGDIVITNIYYDQSKDQNKTVITSPRKK